MLYRVKEEKMTDLLTWDIKRIPFESELVEGLVILNHLSLRESPVKVRLTCQFHVF